MITKELKDAFIFHRRTVARAPYGMDFKGRRAALALYLAQVDVAANVKRYPPSAQGRLMWENGGTPYDWRQHEVMFVESPESVGLRVVGYADEIAGRRIEHTGWYSDSFQSDKYRGVVFQLPSRSGCAVYLSGYQELDHRDKNMTGGYLVALRRQDWNIGDKGADDYRHDSDAAKDAARDADSLAEKNAEESRDHDEAWQNGNRYGDLIREGRDLRLQRRKLMVTLRAARADLAKLGTKFPWADTLCRAIRADIVALKAESARLHAQAEELLSGRASRDPLRSAFAEGAGLDI